MICICLRVPLQGAMMDDSSSSEEETPQLEIRSLQAYTHTHSHNTHIHTHVHTRFAGRQGGVVNNPSLYLILKQFVREQAKKTDKADQTKDTRLDKDKNLNIQPQNKTKNKTKQNKCQDETRTTQNQIRISLYPHTEHAHPARIRSEALWRRHLLPR